MLFAHLDRAEGGIPLPSRTGTSDGLHILNHRIREGQPFLELSHKTGFGFPSTSRRGGNALCAVETVLEAFGSPPLTKPPCPAHGSAHFHRFLHMVGRFHHQIEYRVLRSNDTETLELRSGIDPDHQGLIGWFLLVSELDCKQSELVPPGLGLATLEQMASFRRGTRHERDTSAIQN